jgi:hypothetical protein
MRFVTHRSDSSLPVYCDADIWNTYCRRRSDADSRRLPDSGRIMGKSEVMPGTDSQRRCPEVLFENIIQRCPRSPFLDNFRIADDTPGTETASVPEALDQATGGGLEVCSSLRPA